VATKAKLPNTEDPFELLGAYHGADERIITRAYNRLIRTYRRDGTAPDLARIEQAYVQARTIATGDGPAPSIQAELVALIDEGRYDELEARVTAPTMLDAALADRHVAIVLLRAAGALSWRYGQAIRLVRRLEASTDGGYLRPWIKAADQEISFAQSANALLRNFPSPLFDVLADATFASQAGRARTFAALAPFLGDAATPLAYCDRLVAADRGVVEMMVRRLQVESPLWSDRALAPLSERVRADLGMRLFSVERHSATFRKVLAAVAATVLFLAIGAGMIMVMDIEHADTSIMVAMIGPATVVGYYETDRRNRYKRRIRPKLGQHVAQLGVQADAVAAWVDTDEMGNNLRAFRKDLAADLGMTFLGAMCALVRENERGDRLPD
jgi:hypothetical protein